jgi:hypothetical protein
MRKTEEPENNYFIDKYYHVCSQNCTKDTENIFINSFINIIQVQYLHDILALHKKILCGTGPIAVKLIFGSICVADYNSELCLSSLLIFGVQVVHQ